MSTKAPVQSYEMGMVGLGVMGRNLLLNMGDHGFSVAGYDKDPAKVDALEREAGQREVRGARDAGEFVALLRKPRAVMILVPAGPPVDSVIGDLLPRLDKGDCIIDAGNSFFKDTNLRAAKLAEKGILFLGVGVSGGEEGARHGPSMMPGGPPEGYERIRKVLEAVAAVAGGEPCVAYLGPNPAGHFVKTVHNGIEYGIMQLIAECYDLMKRGLGLGDEEIREAFTAWDKDELQSYLVGITGEIFGTKDEKTGRLLIDQILDVSKQNGTGMWTSQSAMDLQVPATVIDAAVAMRNLSSLESQRKAANALLAGAAEPIAGARSGLLAALPRALYAGMIVAYAQGMAVLSAASEKYGYGLSLETVARIWRGGCIIRAGLLEDIRAAYRSQPKLPNLLLDPAMAKKVMSHQDALRRVAGAAAAMSVPAPALMAALAYLDAFRSPWLPANLIQAQRDFFGSHTYERIDAKGSFHTQWEKA